jgi:uncharacterized membrane protein YhhN
MFATMLPYIGLTAFALAIVLWAEQAGRPIWNLVMKPVASLGFLGAAVAGHALDHVWGQALFIALAWSFVGDVLLIFKTSRPLFILGIGAFLMSHLGYVMVFKLRGVDWSAIGAAAIVFALVGVFVWRWLAPHVKGGMRSAVIAYIAVISLMVAFSVGTTAARPHWLPIAAAFTFWLSDLTVARQRFVKEDVWNRVLGLPLYYGAQFLFVAMLPELVPPH